jgi:hypothetical protein
MWFTYGYTHSIRAETVWVSSEDRFEYALFLQVLKTYNSCFFNWYSVWKLEGYLQRTVRLFKHRVHQQLGRDKKQRIRRLDYQARQGCFQLTATHHPSPDHPNRFLF